MADVYLLLGGNAGDRISILNKARDLIKLRVGEIINKSCIYESEPWGFDDNTNFLNQVLLVETALSCEILLTEILKIEKLLGRVRQSNHYETRIIDIDILFYEDNIINKENLIVPHPLIQKRRFTLIPLNEIAMDFIHPVLKKTIKELLEECDDRLKVEIYYKTTVF